MGVDDETDGALSGMYGSDLFTVVALALLIVFLVAVVIGIVALVVTVFIQGGVAQMPLSICA